MYLYLGQNTVVQTGDIVGIFDLENTSVSRLTKHFLKRAQTAGQVVEVSADLPKSFIVCEEKERTRVYLSHISPLTLRKRTTYVKNLGLPD